MTKINLINIKLIVPNGYHLFHIRILCFFLSFSDYDLKIVEFQLLEGAITKIVILRPKSPFFWIFCHGKWMPGCYCCYAKIWWIKFRFFWFIAILEGGHIVPPHSSYIQKPCTIRVNCDKWKFWFELKININPKSSRNFSHQRHFLHISSTQPFPFTHLYYQQSI